MPDEKITKINMPNINSFDFQIKYCETNRETHIQEIDVHTHNEFELYINIAGDISFLVEDSLYPVSRGDVIIARPGELHHCVYRSNKPHKLFWILFDCQKNNDFWDFLKQDFCENFISPSDELKEETLNICYTLLNKNLSSEEQIYYFLRLFSILKESSDKDYKSNNDMPKDMSKIIDYINRNIYEEFTVNEIAKEFYISQSTLERRFKQTLNITPLEFIRRKKLILAAQMLRSGESVLQVGTSLGYNDNSYFIEIFRNYFGCTPHEYKSSGNHKGNIINLRLNK